MILVVHKAGRVSEVLDLNTNQELNIHVDGILDVMYHLAETSADRFIVWCEANLKSHLAFDFLQTIYEEHKLLSYADKNYFPEEIGYVEQTPFIKINRKWTYPTWLMSSDVGLIHASQLLKFKSVVRDSDLDFALNSMAKLGRPKGLWCYSEPRLLKPGAEHQKHSASRTKLFRFVKQHYKRRWVWLLVLDYILYQNKWPVLPFVMSWFYSRRTFDQTIDQKISNLARQGQDWPSVDVIIPTLFRKDFLYDVLRDLAAQSLLPKNVIIIEQNPEPGSSSELDYLQKETWPFKIIHQFIYQLGACNARNLGLEVITSEYVFFADDDIRMDKNVIEKSIDTMLNFQCRAVTLSCLRKGDREVINHRIQWHTFGSGCSIVRAKDIENIRFDLAFEHGFGEDADFGMQMRNTGMDVIYLPDCRLIHLKAPVGGFRNDIKQTWMTEPIQPKPSPTVMLLNLKHRTTSQRLGYKTTLFLNFFKYKPVLNIFGYVSGMRKRWRRSMHWAQVLQQIKDRT